MEYHKLTGNMRTSWGYNDYDGENYVSLNLMDFPRNMKVYLWEHDFVWGYPLGGSLMIIMLWGYYDTIIMYR